MPRKPSRQRKEEWQLPPHVQARRPVKAQAPTGLQGLRSPKVIVGGVLLVVLATACACSTMDDDDACDSLGTTGTVFAAGSSGVKMAAPAQAPSAALPASGGFGTHLASCGG